MKKEGMGSRLLVTLLVGVMTFSAAKMPTSATENHQYLAPTNPQWSTSKPGVGTVDIVDPTRGYVVAALYRDGHEITTHSGPSSETSTHRYDFFHDIDKSGSYTFKVKMSADDGNGSRDMSSGAVSAMSAAYNYVRPDKVVATPGNLRWSSDEPNVAMWDPVEHASGYVVRLQCDDSFVVGYYTNSSTTKRSFSSEMADTDGHVYKFSVKAFSENIETYANSEASGFSAAYGGTSGEQAVQDNIATAANANESTVNDAVNKLKSENDVNTMSNAIQNSETTQQNLSTLENTYNQKNNITVNTNSELDTIPTSGMSVVGAGLNAEAGSTVTLNVSKAPVAPQYDTDIYTNVISFDMKLVDVKGSTKTELTQLSIPAVITLPIPAGMDTANLFILHFKSDGSHEKITPALIDNGTKAKFTITSFSTFAFANSNSGSGTYKNLEWENVGGKSYWYENNVRQGTASDSKCFSYDGTLRGREIYDPASDGWYWLDVNANGAKAVGKEVFMPYVYQDEKNWSESEIKENAKASGALADGNLEHAELAAQVQKAIQNGTGKWVRYDSNGKMLKGWVKIQGSLAELYPDQAGNIYYYDRKTGLMAKGYTVIDGTTYHFDEVTGALK